MNKVSNNRELEQAILKLKAQKEADMFELKSQISASMEELRPTRIIQRIADDLKNEPQVQNNVIQSTISLAVGYLTKRLLIGKSNSFFKSVLGYLVQIGATKIVSNKIITNNK
ncbi:hypothetical protein U8527_07585 [Kordia algicida OT-1]|uniref:Uncharacterized protein n=1 Tax=Kordia algicida OT-1 TaxID=391587 RepID=A9E8C1_9FLAO|nr:hypothetical protein [Kordia algicida]EDP94765.1 hypothetical protein KAOT1_01025 [Kordia algicida OT-1]